MQCGACCLSAHARTRGAPCQTLALRGRPRACSPTAHLPEAVEAVEAAEAARRLRQSRLSCVLLGCSYPILVPAVMCPAAMPALHRVQRCSTRAGRLLNRWSTLNCAFRRSSWTTSRSRPWRPVQALTHGGCICPSAPAAPWCARTGRSLLRSRCGSRKQVRLQK